MTSNKLILNSIIIQVYSLYVSSYLLDREIFSSWKDWYLNLTFFWQMFRILFLPVENMHFGEQSLHWIKFSGT